MKDEFLLIVLTPYGKYLETEVSFLSIASEEYTLGILKNHADLISSIKICSMLIKTSTGNRKFAVGGGLIKIKDNVVTLVVNSCESIDEIDLARALNSKNRALERINLAKNDSSIDIYRAEASLKRALNRINLKEENH